MPRLSELRLVRIVVVSVAVVLFTFVSLFLMIAAYAVALTFQSGGTPDTARIEQFARAVGPWLQTGFAVIATFVAAAWTGHRVPHHKIFHGVLVGVLAAILILALDVRGGFQPIQLIGFTLSIVAGWLGGILATGGSQEV